VSRLALTVIAPGTAAWIQAAVRANLKAPTNRPACRNFRLRGPAGFATRKQRRERLTAFSDACLIEKDEETMFCYAKPG
jgi:hypothetical protein